MTDKEKIEEMAKVLHDRIVNQTWRAEKVAEELYKIAVPEGSVVLSNEVFERLSIFKVEIAQRIKDEERKETAREIFAWLKEHCDYSGFTIIEAYFKETFGVDIKE